MNRGAFDKAQALRDLLESVADDAFCVVPALPEHAAALWRCVRAGGGALGLTFVAPPTATHLKLLAIDADCWWRWDEAGEPHSMTLAEARAAYEVTHLVIDDATAVAVLRTLREMVDAEYWPAIDYAIGRLDGQNGEG